MHPTGLTSAVVDGKLLLLSFSVSVTSHCNRPGSVVCLSFQVTEGLIISDHWHLTDRQMLIQRKNVSVWFVSLTCYISPALKMKYVHSWCWLCSSLIVDFFPSEMFRPTSEIRSCLRHFSQKIFPLELLLFLFLQLTPPNGTWCNTSKINAKGAKPFFRNLHSTLSAILRNSKDPWVSDLWTDVWQLPSRKSALEKCAHGYLAMLHLSELSLESPRAK